MEGAEGGAGLGGMMEGGGARAVCGRVSGVGLVDGRSGSRLPVAPLDTCPILLTTLDLLDLQSLLLSAPAVVRIIKVKARTKVPSRAKTNFPPTGHP